MLFMAPYDTFSNPYQAQIQPNHIVLWLLILVDILCVNRSRCQEEPPVLS